MTTPALPSKLLKLIPMLSSDNDGEVVNSARAIGRALRAAGADFHDLAKALTATAAVASKTPKPNPVDEWARNYKPPPPRPRPRWERLTVGERIMALDYLSHAGCLSRWERDFAKSIQALVEARPYGSLSSKQINILDNMLAKDWEENG